MNIDRLVTALALPAAARVDQRVPKKLLVENGAPTAADRRQINEGIEELLWLAALKPTTIGVPEYRDSARAYLEIAVLRLTLRPGARTPRLRALVHRAVPYPVLLLTEQGTETDVSAVHKRWAQNEADKTVLDGDIAVVAWGGPGVDGHDPAFLAAMELGRQPRASLHALYAGWIDTMTSLMAARVTGAWQPVTQPVLAAARRDGLSECARLDLEIARTRAIAAKEKRLNRRVDLNMTIQRLQAALAIRKQTL